MYDTNWEVEFEILERRYKELEKICDIKDREIRRLHDVCRELQEEPESTSITKINDTTIEEYAEKNDADYGRCDTRSTYGNGNICSGCSPQEDKGKYEFDSLHYLENNEDKIIDYVKSEKLDNDFTVKISCDGDLDEEGLTELLRDMLDNKVNCTEYVIDIYED